MAPAAGNRSGIFGFSQFFLVTADTGSVRNGSQGRAIFLAGVPVTVTAGAFLSLGVKKLLGDGIVLMVACFTLITLGFTVAVMQRIIHADRLP